ncbi:MAG: thioredoxin family protein [Mycoplasma sp.]|nr:thioredoxin family protein [Mycoplasma sp.]MDD7149741.1 thioredoxin family protein [Mycoplasma sp.]MDY4544271.1 thioredoxin family protein [Bacilli bacterium]MDY4619460.1 thioredoxin family protein [Bacilli bacterium]
MKINIIGENSSNRMKLLKNLKKVTKNEDINIEINVIDDKETLSKYKDKNKPILMINEKIISNGKILTDREIRNYIKIFA